MQLATTVKDRLGAGRVGDVTPAAALRAMHEVMGVHPGCRAAHARGTLCRGVFMPTERASRLTTAPHMQWTEAPAQQLVPVLVRFSNASGDPGFSDAARDARGMATRFHPDDARSTDIVAVTLPCFFAPDPPAFMEFNQAFKRRGAGRVPLIRPIRLLRYLRDHYDARSGIFHALRGIRVPSYANCRYNALHAFKWIDAAGEARFVRYSWVPDAGEKEMSGRDARKQTADYLQRDLYDRLGREPVRPIRFTLELQVAPRPVVDARLICDPTSRWPEEWERLQAGLLEVTALDAESAAEPAPHDETELLGDAKIGDVVRRQISQKKPREFFDPLRLSAGIEPPSLEGDESQSCCDRILAFRPPVYGLSYDERTGRRPADA
jgi:catalase